MHTSHDTAANVRRRPPPRLPLYYRGRRAEVWIAACERRGVYPGTEGLTR
jgi:hypothetical protein